MSYVFSRLPTSSSSHLVHCTTENCENGRPNKKRPRDDTVPTPPPPRRPRKKRGKYRVKLVQDLKLKDEAIERCKEFIRKQHEELERVNGLLQKYIDRDNSLHSMSQLSASGPATQEEEDDDEDTFAGNLSKNGALVPESQQFRLIGRTTTLTSLPGTPPGKVHGEDGEIIPLSQLSDVGGRRGLSDIMTFLKRTFMELSCCVYEFSLSLSLSLPLTHREIPPHNRISQERKVCHHGNARKRTRRRRRRRMIWREIITRFRVSWMSFVVL